MSVTKMQPGREANKRLTAVDGTGLTKSASMVRPTVTPPNIRVSTAGNPHFTGEEDSQATKTGAGGGEIATAGGANPPRWGYTAPSGSRIEVNDSAGGEHITVVHHSGAGFTVDPDGAVFITSSSARGVGVGAPTGDISITAGGEIVISGDASISVKTAGDLNLQVGGTFNVKCAAFNLVTNTMDATIDGSKSESITNDHSQIIGGVHRQTVAGDSRTQVSGNTISDVGGSSTSRVDGDHSRDVGGNTARTTGGNATVSTKGNVDATTDGNCTVQTGGNHATTAGGNHDVIAAGTTTVKGDSGINMATPGGLGITAGTTDMTGGQMNLDGNLSGPSPVNPTTDEAGDPTEADVPEVNDIIDLLTSARLFPEYKGNGVIEGAIAAAIGMVSHDTSPQAEDVYQQYSKGNQGSLNPSYSGGSYDTLPETPVNRSPNIEPYDPGIAVPDPHNPASMISDYYSAASLVNAPLSWKIPPGKYDEVMANYILLATNVLDPLKKVFPDIVITNGYRDNSENHSTGRACDLQVSNKSLTRHAEIARYARDHLPVDQVFLERSDSGKTHVHLRVATSKGSPSVITCGDKLCAARTSGIDVEYLVRRGVVRD